MLNKKILAAAIAASLSTSAFATVDFTADAGAGAADPVVYATELAQGAADADGYATADNVASLLDFVVEPGFTIGNGTSKYIRIALSGAKFTDDVPDLTVANGTALIAQGGAAGDTYVIFEVAATADIPTTANMTIAADSYDILASSSFNITSVTYETAGDAVNETSPLFTDTGTVATFANGSDGEFAVAGTNTATVASEFQNFDANSESTVLADVGLIDWTQVLTSTTTYTLAGAAATPADFLTTTQVVSVAGDFSFGTWTLETGADCATGTPVAATVDADEATITTDAGFDLSSGTLRLCVLVSDATTDDMIEKGTYTGTLVTDELDDLVGTIKYDTTSIEVPYLTTYSEYNQRIYLVNNGSQDAAYSFSFVSEDGVTADAKDAATGTIPAGEMITLKATDLVTLTGKTRTSAVIEVEAEDSVISASTQTVNKANGGTDTTILNANSIISYEELVDIQ